MNLSKESVLSLNECKETIRNYLQSDEFEVINYEIGPFSDCVNGFLSDQLLITINYATNDGKKTKSFFGKMFPHQYELQSRYAVAVGTFRREILIYKVLLNEFKKCRGFTTEFVPAYYYIKDDLFVFENLNEQHFVIHDSPNALPLDHVELCLQLLAQFHAGSIGYQELKTKELKRQYRLIEDYSEYIQEPLFRKEENFLGYLWFKTRLGALNAIVDCLQFPDITSKCFKEKIKVVADYAFEIMTPKSKFYNVVCHGDMWAKNFLFRYQNGTLIDAKMIDFQFLRYCPPAHDVLQLLFMVMGRKRRQSHLHSCLRFYYECLRKELRKSDFDIDEIIPYADFEASVNYLLPQIKLQTAFYHGFQSTNVDFHKSLKENPGNLKELIFGDAASFAITLFNTDSDYNKLLVDAITELKILLTHDIITQEDCYKIVEKKLGTTDYKLIDYSMSRVTGISGFLGDHYRLKIVLANDELNLFAKCAPKCTTRFDLAVGAKVFVKEYFLLETLIPMIKEAGVDDIEECVVPHHLIRVNDVIVFDDLTFNGFRAGSQRVPFTFEELKIVVRKLGVYHASNIILEEKLSRNENTFRLSSFKNEVEESFFCLGDHNQSSLSIKLGVETVPFQVTLFELDFSGFETKIRKAYEACYQLVKPSELYRNVVCHGDLWADNIMMKYDNKKPIDCRIIDYQILRYCPPAQDLMSLLYLTTTRAVRSEHMATLINFYYDVFSNTLNRHGCDVASVYTYKHFLDSCYAFVPQAVCQTVIFYHFTMTNPELMKDYIKDDELTRKIFLNDRRDFIKDMCEKDPVYKTRMRESLEDLKEMCIKYF